MIESFSTLRIFFIIIGALFMAGIKNTAESSGFSNFSSWLISTISLFIYWVIIEEFFFT